MTLKLIGGNNSKNITYNIMEKLMTNRVAILFSFLGRQKKLSFKNTLPQMLIAITSDIQLYLMVYK